MILRFHNCTSLAAILCYYDNWRFSTLMLVPFSIVWGDMKVPWAGFKVRSLGLKRKKETDFFSWPFEQNKRTYVQGFLWTLKSSIMYHPIDDCYRYKYREVSIPDNKIKKAQYLHTHCVFCTCMLCGIVFLSWVYTNIYYITCDAQYPSKSLQRRSVVQVLTNFFQRISNFHMKHKCIIVSRKQTSPLLNFRIMIKTDNILKWLIRSLFAPSKIIIWKLYHFIWDTYCQNVI